MVIILHSISVRDEFLHQKLELEPSTITSNDTFEREAGRECNRLCSRLFTNVPNNTF